MSFKQFMLSLVNIGAVSHINTSIFDANDEYLILDNHGVKITQFFYDETYAYVVENDQETNRMQIDQFKSMNYQVYKKIQVK